jgi:hypothetical protein
MPFGPNEVGKRAAARRRDPHRSYVSRIGVPITGGLGTFQPEEGVVPLRLRVVDESQRMGADVTRGDHSGAVDPNIGYGLLK